MKKSQIILDECPLNESFFPQTPLGRESHANQMLSCLGCIRQGIPPKNLYVYGAPGTGKTTTVRSVLREHFGDVSVYVNCWNNRTPHKVMEEILKQMDSDTGRKFVHGKESTSELIKRFERLKKKVIVCLDESDQLKKHDILYVFTRNSCPLILISNHSYSPTSIDERIKSSLHIEEIEFRPYEADDVTQILKDRITAGLDPQSITDELIKDIANSCGGDARAGIQILKNAAVDAESKGHDAIMSEHIRNAAKCARKFRLSYLLRKLNDHQKMLYEILKQNKTMDSGLLFNEYRKVATETVTDRSYRNYMQRMVELGLAREISSGRWKKYEIV